MTGMIHSRIHSVGGINPDRTRWKLSEDAAIAGIREGKWHFWTTANDKSVSVTIGKSAAGHDYLRTDPDSTTANNLLHLPECP